VFAQRGIIRACLPRQSKNRRNPLGPVELARKFVDHVTSDSPKPRRIPIRTKTRRLPLAPMAAIVGLASNPKLTFGLEVMPLASEAGSPSACRPAPASEGKGRPPAGSGKVSRW